MTKARITKRIVAIATTMLMLAFMVMPASAAEQGKITVTKLAGDSMTGALPNFTGAEVGTLPTGFTPLAGAGFTVFQIPNAALTTQVINKATGGVTITGHSVSTSVPPAVTWRFSDGSANVTIPAVTVPWGAEQMSDAAGKITFDGGSAAGIIPDGWYVLVETTTPSGHVTANPSLIQMPLTLQNGQPNYDIHVYPKNINEDKVAVKSMSGVDRPVSHGDSITFQLKTQFLSSSVSSVSDLRATPGPSANNADYGMANIEERFSPYFTRTTNIENIRVNWLGTDGNIAAGALTNNTDYIIVALPATATAGETIGVALTRAGIDKAIAANATGFGFELTAQYTGRPSAGIGTAAPVINTMHAIIAAPGDTASPPTVIVTTEVPTISVTGTKVDEDGDPLAGATFKIATVAVNPQPNDFVKDANNADIVVTTDATGIFSFSNLPNYSNTDGITYYLIETAAPAGYNGGSVIAVRWDNKAWYQTNHADNFDAQQNWRANIDLLKTIEVENTLIGENNPHSPGFSLPLTGGTGTLLFTAIGIIVMLGATGAYLHGKKRNLEK